MYIKIFINKSTCGTFSPTSDSSFSPTFPSVFFNPRNSALDQANHLDHHQISHWNFFKVNVPWNHQQTCNPWNRKPCVYPKSESWFNTMGRHKGWVVRQNRFRSSIYDYINCAHLDLVDNWSLCLRIVLKTRSWQACCFNLFMLCSKRSVWWP